MIVSHQKQLALGLVLSWALAAQNSGSPAQTALQALESKDYPRAVQLYRDLASQEPACAECLNNLGIALHAQGKSTEAIRAFEKALEIKELPGTLALLGADYCRIREYDRARTVLLRAKSYFSNSDVLATLGPCYIEAGDPIDAITVYRELVKRNESPADENGVNLARAYLKASQEYLGRLQKAPGNSEYVAAVMSAREKATADARGAFPHAFQNAPYLRRDMSPGEIAKFLPEHPQDAALLYIMGVLCGEQAMKTVLFSEEHFPGSIPVRRLHAEMLASQGQEDAALAAYKDLETASPVPIGLYAETAILYRKQGNWEKCLEYFDKQRATMPDDEQSLAGISESLLKLERYKDLRKFLLPIASSQTPPRWALLDIATAEKELGQPQVAIRWLKQAALQDPKNSSVHYRLSRLYSQTNQPDLADKEMKIFQRLKGTAHSSPLG